MVALENWLMEVLISSEPRWEGLLTRSFFKLSLFGVKVSLGRPINEVGVTVISASVIFSSTGDWL